MNIVSQTRRGEKVAKKMMLLSCCCYRYDSMRLSSSGSIVGD